MKWLTRGSVLVAAALAGCGDAQGPAEFNGAATFDSFWETFDRTYSYFELKHIDWNAARAAYRDRAANAADHVSLVNVLREMVEPMRDVHIWFRDPAGTTIATWQPTHFRNWNRDVWLAYMGANRWVQQRTNWGYADFSGIPYIAIGSWNTSQVNIDTVDAVLNQFRDKPAIIIDVRMNGGGNDALALQVAGRFTRETRLIEYVQFRDGPDHDDFTPLQPRYLQPRGPWQYEGNVVVLSGRGVYSSNETFISALREIPSVTVMGDTTGGSSGNPGEFELGGGWTYFVPRWIAYTPDGRVIEWNGIEPDLIIPVTAADFAAGRDPVLDFALSFLRGQIPGRPRRVGRRRCRTASDGKPRPLAAAVSGVSRRSMISCVASSPSNRATRADT
jgi:hypothetical protein